MKLKLLLFEKLGLSNTRDNFTINMDRLNQLPKSELQKPLLEKFEILERPCTEEAKKISEATKIFLQQVRQQIRELIKHQRFASAISETPAIEFEDITYNLRENLKKAFRGFEGFVTPDGTSIISIMIETVVENLREEYKEERRYTEWLSSSGILQTFAQRLLARRLGEGGNLIVSTVDEIESDGILAYALEEPTDSRYLGRDFLYEDGKIKIVARDGAISVYDPTKETIDRIMAPRDHSERIQRLYEEESENQKVALSLSLTRVLKKIRNFADASGNLFLDDPVFLTEDFKRLFVASKKPNFDPKKLKEQLTIGARLRAFLSPEGYTVISLEKDGSEVDKIVLEKDISWE